ncbi:MAG TPA: bacteriophage abortive infection AbiH family protein, partial [Candidatus Mediterraneibacter intestinigallinarum]|nr:bacteriophage abortive infection AbiH family protein [Candidatus Mediterraneibacter intestinigallinarum]
MNILIIGNGFDLAHGLPTRYGDFIDNVKNE